MALALSACACSAHAQSAVIFNETFGSSTIRMTSPNVPKAPPGGNSNLFYQFADRNSTVWVEQAILDGHYAIINPAALYAAPAQVEDKVIGDWWKRGTRWKDIKVGEIDPVSNTPVVSGKPPAYTETVPYGQANPAFYRQWYPSEYTDADGNANGAVMVVNAGTVKNDIYRRTVTLAPGKSYKLSAQVFYVQSPGELAFRLLPANGVDSTTELAKSASYITPTITLPPVYTANGGAALTWSEMTPLTFTVPASCDATPQIFAVALANQKSVNDGNDLFVDNITLEEVPGTVGTPVPCAPQVPVVLANPASDDRSTSLNTPVAIDVMTNDNVTDPEGHPVSDVPLTAPVVQTPPSHGSTSVDGDGNIIFTPNKDWWGTDSFTYQVCTATTDVYVNSDCKTAKVTVTIAPPPTIPGITTAVPVDNPWALLLAGLGIAGLAASRTKRKS